VKRICPVCGAANPLEAERCFECGADIERNMPVIREGKLPVPWKEVGASLAVGAAALALRAGLHLLQGLLEKREAKPSPSDRALSPLSKLRRWLPRRGEEEEAHAPQPQIKVWGRRARGMWRSDGASHWEVEEFLWEK
jgi:hypothetical protein